MALKSDISVAKGLKLKVRKFWGLIPTFAEVTGEDWIVKILKNSRFNQLFSNSIA